MNVAAVLMEILRAAGVRYLFGNPGTTELPFLDALPDSGLEYVLGLQEATAVAAADGYAQASGRVGVVNVHVAPGLANSLSILHNAARAKSPLVVTAGQQDTRFLMHEPILAGDLARMAEPFTKWSHEIRRPEDAPVALRRALKVALTPPTGPVFLSMPMDLMGPAIDDTGAPSPAIAAQSRPEPAALLRAAELLAGASNPIIIAGDGVARAHAVGELTALAELLGARVHGEPVYRRTSFPGNHALWRGGLFPSPAGVRRALEECDALLIVGANAFTWFLYTEGTPFPRGLRVVKIGAARGDMMKRVSDAARSEAERVPIGQAHLMHTLASLLPADAIVVDESATSLPFVLRYMPFATPGSFYGSKTGTLGWGMGAAIGVQLGSPGRKVVATIGDGSVMYAPQALWTAAHYRLAITYVVPNNSSYAILKSGMLSLDLASAKRGIYPGMDLVSPEIDYAGLARSLGVRAERVEKPGELRDVLAACLAGPGPSLVDVAIDRGFKPML